jgi:hypothetical protein
MLVSFGFVHPNGSESPGAPGTVIDTGPRADSEEDRGAVAHDLTCGEYGSPISIITPAFLSIRHVFARVSSASDTLMTPTTWGARTSPYALVARAVVSSPVV